MFKRRTVLIEPIEMTVGEFDPSVDGAYRNIKTMPLELKAGRTLNISIGSDRPVDIAVSGPDGKCMGFRDAFLSGKISMPIDKKGTAALMLGVFRGDLAKIKIEAWME